jgi:hypothetical protein
VFEKSDPGGRQSETFALSVERLNGRADVLNGTRVDAYLQYAESTVSAYRVACTLLEHSVMAVVSSLYQDDSLVGAVASHHHVSHSFYK